MGAKLFARIECFIDEDEHIGVCVLAVSTGEFNTQGVLAVADRLERISAALRLGPVEFARKMTSDGICVRVAKDPTNDTIN